VGTRSPQLAPEKKCRTLPFGDFKSATGNCFSADRLPNVRSSFPPPPVTWHRRRRLYSIEESGRRTRPTEGEGSCYGCSGSSLLRLAVLHPRLPVDGCCQPYYQRDGRTKKTRGLLLLLLPDAPGIEKKRDYDAKKRTFFCH
jgi:hypothetical protein